MQRPAVWNGRGPEVDFVRGGEAGRIVRAVGMLIARFQPRPPAFGIVREGRQEGRPALMATCSAWRRRSQVERMEKLLPRARR